MCLMSSGPHDWAIVEGLARSYPKFIIPAFGLHPWYAHKAPANWLAELRGYLERNGNAIIGEIGLDKKAVDLVTKQRHDGAQLDAFTAQLDLAIELGRSCSIHCVGAHAIAYEQLRDRLSSLHAIAFHSYGGSIGSLQQLIRLAQKQRAFDRIFFGFSTVINTRSPKLNDVIAAVPQSQLLVESDQASAEFVREEIDTMLGMMANAHAISKQQVAAITFENATRAFTNRQ